MGRNKKLRKRVAGLEEQITLHRAKIAHERMESAPDRQLLRKWAKDITVWEKQIARLKAKLPGKGEKK
ncbi:hypothetical protein HYR54_06440 [Candidatus Acetothermia bacterium]|nr:hypothetical protein [Candidatus Acetothermia bacterium]MBI3459768.1 hypothetical protein [Candidatus Acetothermia bacterium]